MYICFIILINNIFIIFSEYKNFFINYKRIHYQILIYEFDIKH